MSVNKWNNKQSNNSDERNKHWFLGENKVCVAFSGAFIAMTTMFVLFPLSKETNIISVV